jgi:hypothetical protein
MSRTIIGLAGMRQVGKTHITKHLCEKHGFKSVHPFDVWKDGIKAMFTSIGIDEAMAEDMVRGELKDTVHGSLPDEQDARYLMERLGKYAGKELGPQWTLGLSLQKMDQQFPDANLIIESIVYEVDVIRKFGGHIIMVERPGVVSRGLETDKETLLINPDSTFLNDTSELDLMKIEIDAHLQREGLLPRVDQDMEIC